MGFELSTSYLIGIVAAIIAGIAFSLGMVIQKLAVMKTSRETRLMRQLVRSPLWLTGFALQFFVGTPLNMLAQTNDTKIKSKRIFSKRAKHLYTHDLIIRTIDREEPVQYISKGVHFGETYRRIL